MEDLEREEDDIPHLDWIVEKISESLNGKVIKVDAYRLHVMVAHTVFEVWYDHVYRYKQKDSRSWTAPTRTALLSLLGLVFKPTNYRIEYDDGEGPEFRL